MPIPAGARLGPYEILSALGTGGMGEVYRARDTKLGRDVAIKVLLPAVANDPDRLARFSREAQVLAALNHPNIAHIYGLEEAGGAEALVLELVDGEDLAALIARRPVPVDEALPIAKQIAEALEAAHELGIIHRDLKPSNIKIRPDGTVKVLDFGLAKALDSMSAAPANVTGSPTLTSPAMMTGAGLILGTAAYMAPEQARGKAVDKRADIWAFGCVLFEMLSGRQAFGGETISDSIAAVIHKDPAWDALPPDTPPPLRSLLQRCLQKDPRQRLRDAGDVRLALDDAQQTPSGSSGASTTRRAGMASTIAAVLVAATAAATVTWLVSRRPAEQAPAIARYSVTLPADAPLDVRGPWGSLAISRDGHTIAYVAQVAEGRQLFLRRDDDPLPHAVAGTGGVWEAFFSPDGRWLAFVAADRLKKVAVTGGQPSLVADAANLNSGVWADDGSIYLGGRAGLVRVASDGKMTTLAKPNANEIELAASDLLPDGSLLFTIKPNDVTSFDDARIAVLTPRGERRVVLEGGSFAKYVPTGHLVYARGGEIMAVPFDVQHLVVSGQPTAVARGGMFDTASGVAHFAVSRTGVFAYAPGGPAPHDEKLAWIDRRGTVTPVDTTPQFFSEPSISPDGRQIAFDIRAANDDIWVYDIARGTFARLTFTHGNNQAPIWSPDGTRVVYAVDRLGVRRLAWRPADGSGAEELLTPAQYYQTPGSWSPDGKLLAYTEDRPETAGDIYVLPIDGERTPRGFLTTQASERHPMFSPDGHWIAFESDETGHLEVFVAAYPGPGRKWQISNGGGRRPLWMRNGREIVYANGDRLMTVAVTPAATFQPGSPREIVRLPGHVSYFDVTPDGQRFLLVQRATSDVIVRELNVVLNWFETLKTRVTK